MIIKESFVDVGEEVSLKSTSSFCVKPFATSQTLSLSVLSFESLFILIVKLIRQFYYLGPFN